MFATQVLRAGLEDVLHLLEDLAAGARRVAAEAADSADDWEAFRTVFTQGCALDEAELRLFDALCKTSARAGEQGRLITISLITPVTDRAKSSGLLRQDVTTEDVAAFMRMADSTSDARQRQITQQVLLTGLRTQRP
ncbi:hypothetical protein ACFWIB_34050 [Streptomyces sp. NPDC127051]|uniref:hypothetical protein n=1 Tax=Streptomyces sp. NPDC127051 TaxID=3347119 RepID=UPI0036624843